MFACDKSEISGKVSVEARSSPIISCHVDLDENVRVGPVEGFIDKSETSTQISVAVDLSPISHDLAVCEMDTQLADLRCVPVMCKGAMDDPDGEMVARDKSETPISVGAHSQISHILVAPCYGYAVGSCSMCSCYR